MKVRVTKKCYFDHSLRHPGDILILSDPKKQFSKRYMEDLSKPSEPKPKVDEVKALSELYAPKRGRPRKNPIERRMEEAPEVEQHRYRDAVDNDVI
jgi:hypothetical protein